MQKRTITFLAGILLLVLIAAGTALYKFNLKHESVAKDRADLSISADKLYDQYSSNEVFADSVYMNKVMIVHGKVLYNKHQNNTYFIQLKANESGNGINCQMMMEDTAALNVVQANQPINIKGKCSGFLADVNLVDCVITQ